MPYIQIATSRTLTAAEKSELKACALQAVTLLGKNKQHVMVHLLDGQALTKGEETGECAFCDVRVLGAATQEACNAFSQTLSADVARIAQVSPMSTYLSLSELTLCYTDGKLPPGHNGR